MKLSEWIAASGGRVAVAQALGITPEAIHYWLNRGASPKIGTMIKIVELSGGKVTFDEIIAETKPVAKKKSKADSV